MRFYKNRSKSWHNKIEQNDVILRRQIQHFLTLNPYNTLLFKHLQLCQFCTNFNNICTVELANRSIKHKYKHENDFKMA